MCDVYVLCVGVGVMCETGICNIVVSCDVVLLVIVCSVCLLWSCVLFENPCNVLSECPVGNVVSIVIVSVLLCINSCLCVYQHSTFRPHFEHVCTKLNFDRKHANFRHRPLQFACGCFNRDHTHETVGARVSLNNPSHRPLCRWHVFVANDHNLTDFHILPYAIPFGALLSMVQDFPMPSLPEVLAHLRHQLPTRKPTIVDRQQIRLRNGSEWLPDEQMPWCQRCRIVDILLHR